MCLLLAREDLLEELLCSEVSGHFLAWGKRKVAQIGSNRGLQFGGAGLRQTLPKQFLVSLSFYRSCRLTALTCFPNSNLSRSLLIPYKLLTVKRSPFFLCLHSATNSPGTAWAHAAQIQWKIWRMQFPFSFEFTMKAWKHSIWPYGHMIPADTQRSTHRSIIKMFWPSTETAAHKKQWSILKHNWSQFS